VAGDVGKRVMHDDLPVEVGDLDLDSFGARRPRRACKEAWFRIDLGKGEEEEEGKCED